MSQDNIAALAAYQALVLDQKNPLASAKAFVRRHYTEDGWQILRHHRSDFYEWNGASYSMVDDEQIQSELYHFLDTTKCKGAQAQLVKFNPNRTSVGDVFAALKAATNLPSKIMPPAWLDGAPKGMPAHEMIACPSGLLHVPTRKLLKPGPDFFTLNALDFDYDPRAPKPHEFLQFLGSLWPNDSEARATLKKILGYLVSGNTRQQKIFLIVGPKRSGKGTIARLAEGLVGKENVCWPTLDGLSQRFGLEPLIRKRLAIISDARLSGRANAAAIAEYLLSISGEDSVTTDRKNRPAWTGRLQIRFLILTNEIPSFRDTSGALASRFVVLTLKRSFFGQEDLDLLPRLMAELPGLLNLALDGWDELQRVGHFDVPLSSKQITRQLADLASPVRAFVKECCIAGPQESVLVETLFERWKIWCEKLGHDKPGSQHTFGRDLHALVPEIRTAQPRRPDGKRSREYRGIGLG